MQYKCSKQKGYSGEQPQVAGVHPHAIVAIDYDVAHHKHEQTDEQPRQEVDTLQGNPLRHGTERTAKGQLCEKYERHGADGEQVHHLPCEVVGEPCCQESAALDGRQKDDVKDGKEYCKVATGSYP